MQSVSSSLPVTSTYLPATQSMQSVELLLPGTSMYLPAKHSMQSLSNALPTVSEYLPDAHIVQFDSSGLPVSSTNLPATQSAQSCWPPKGCTVPGLQGSQTWSLLEPVEVSPHLPRRMCPSVHVRLAQRAEGHELLIRPCPV